MFFRQWWQATALKHVVVLEQIVSAPFGSLTSFEREVVGFKALIACVGFLCLPCAGSAPTCQCRAPGWAQYSCWGCFSSDVNRQVICCSIVCAPGWYMLLIYSSVVIYSSVNCYSGSGLDSLLWKPTIIIHLYFFQQGYSVVSVSTDC